MHAERLRERIVALGGKPSMNVSIDSLKYATDIQSLLKINIEEEKQTLVAYKKVFKNTAPDNALLYQTLQEIIRDEQEHLEELELFLG